MCHHIGCLGLLVCHCSFHLPAFWRFSNIIFKGYEKRKERWEEIADLMLTPHYFINNKSPHPPKMGSDSSPHSAS